MYVEAVLPSCKSRYITQTQLLPPLNYADCAELNKRLSSEQHN